MKKVKLWHCILADLIGMLSYFIPAFGETIDIIWAPLSGILFFLWFRKPIGAFIATAEELIPFLDFIPSFTIAFFWLKRKSK